MIYYKIKSSKTWEGWEEISSIFVERISIVDSASWSFHARSGYAIWAPLSPRYAGIYAFDVFKGATLSLACRPRALLSPTKHSIPLSRREQCRTAVTCSTFDHYSRSVHKIGKLRRNRATRCAKFFLSHITHGLSRRVVHSWHLHGGRASETKIVSINKSALSTLVLLLFSFHAMTFKHLQSLTYY